MGGNAAIADLTLYVTGFFGSGGEAKGGVVSLAGSGNRISNCRMRANSYLLRAEYVHHGIVTFHVVMGLI